MVKSLGRSTAYFTSASVVLIRRRHAAMAGAKKARGVSFASLMKPCKKAFAPLLRTLLTLVIISPRIFASLEQLVPAIKFLPCHPMQGRGQQFKLVKYQIEKVLHLGVPFFLLPTFPFCTLSESVQLKCSRGQRQ